MQIRSVGVKFRPSVTMEVGPWVRSLSQLNPSQATWVGLRMQYYRNIIGNNLQGWRCQHANERSGSSFALQPWSQIRVNVYVTKPRSLASRYGVYPGILSNSTANLLGLRDPFQSSVAGNCEWHTQVFGDCCSKRCDRILGGCGRLINISPRVR